MARKAIIEREKKRARLVEKVRGKARGTKALANDTTRSFEEQMEARPSASPASEELEQDPPAQPLLRHWTSARVYPLLRYVQDRLPRTSTSRQSAGNSKGQPLDAET